MSNVEKMCKEFDIDMEKYFISGLEELLHEADEENVNEYLEFFKSKSDIFSNIYEKYYNDGIISVAKILDEEKYFKYIFEAEMERWFYGEGRTTYKRYKSQMLYINITKFRIYEKLRRNRRIRRFSLYT